MYWTPFLSVTFDNLPWNYDSVEDTLKTIGLSGIILYVS